MSGRAILPAIAALFAWAQVVLAESFSPLPSPTFVIAFDEIDPATTQAEVARQVTTFLDRVHRHGSDSQESLRRAVDGHLERQDGGVLLFSRSVADHRVLEGYDFEDGRLVRAEYWCIQRSINEINEFVDYYAAAKAALTSAVGPPREDGMVWENDLYRPLPDYWGVAVMMGHLHYAARWEMDDGTLSLELTGHHHSRLKIEYRSNHVDENARTT